VSGTVSLGDALILAGFVFQAGVLWAVNRQHGKFIKEIRDWKHHEVTPRLTNHGLRLGLVEHTLGLEPLPLERV
jgi:hypothetical protein